MPFTSITKPVDGTVTRRDGFANAVVDDLEYLSAQMGAVKDKQVILNGGFEYYATTGVPDGWAVTILNGGSATISTNSSYDGKVSWYASTPGGIGNGGAQIETKEFIKCSEYTYYWFTWAMIASVAGVSCQVKVTFYNRLKTLVGTHTIYKSVINPTTWVQYEGVARSPQSACWLKLALIGGAYDGATAGNVRFDAVNFGRKNYRRIVSQEPGWYGGKFQEKNRSATNSLSQAYGATLTNGWTDYDAWAGLVRQNMTLLSNPSFAHFRATVTSGDYQTCLGYIYGPYSEATEDMRGLIYGIYYGPTGNANSWSSSTVGFYLTKFLVGTGYYWEILDEVAFDSGASMILSNDTDFWLWCDPTTKKIIGKIATYPPVEFDITDDYTNLSTNASGLGMKTVNADYPPGVAAAKTLSVTRIELRQM